MKPRSTTWRNVQRRMFRRYSKILRHVPLETFHNMDDARRKAMLTELLFFKFFISGAIWERENQKFIENAASGPHPDYPDFPAQDIPIFLDPEIMELFQQTAGVQYRVQSRSN